MAGRLLEQLLEAGLITEAQAGTRTFSDPSASSAQVVQNLIATGLDERALAGFFIGCGFGPMLQERDLRRADQNLVRRLNASDAHELCAMPLRSSQAGVIVAMADPSDQEAIAKLSQALGGKILPTVAKLSDLRASIDRAYPADRPPQVTDSSTLTTLQSELASTSSPVWDRAWSGSTSHRGSSVRPLSTPPGQGPELAMEGHLAELRRVASRDELVRAACEACLIAARGAAFLALRKGVFRGWDGAGEEVTSAGIRSLWVPASNPSVLNEVLHSGEVFRGAYGETAADQLFRSGFGGQGREILIAPVQVSHRIVGVLCANDPGPHAGAVERIAEAMGEAFERLILAQKSPN